MNLRDDLNCFEFTSHYAPWHWQTPRPLTKVVAGKWKERDLELVNTFVNTPEANAPTTNGNRGKSLPEINGGVEWTRTPDPLRAKHR